MNGMKATRFFIVMLILVAGRSAAWPQNSNLSQGIYFDGEPCMAADPSNPRHLVVAWMGFIPYQQIAIKTRASFDGGRSWTAAISIPHASPSYT